MQPSINRTDPDFHDVDPVTHRPISGGHPDGVWLIAILFGLVIALTGVQAAAAAISDLRGGEVEMKDYGPFLGSSVLFLPAIVLLVRRRKTAAYWLLGVAVLAFASGLSAWLTADPGAFGLMAAFRWALGIGTFAWIAFYARGLVQDKFLA